MYCVCTRRDFYEHLRDWIIETEFDRYRSGRVFEYMWAVMFGAPPVSEPIEECDLLTCTDEVSTSRHRSKALSQHQHTTTPWLLLHKSSMPSQNRSQ